MFRNGEGAEVLKIPEQEFSWQHSSTPFEGVQPQGGRG
tara:strand:- start:2614 stop:2727 length:114 start_codon:yes stop_codon:yes gene_type:complete